MALINPDIPDILTECHTTRFGVRTHCEISLDYERHATFERGICNYCGLLVASRKDDYRWIWSPLIVEWP